MGSRLATPHGPYYFCGEGAGPNRGPKTSLPFGSIKYLELKALRSPTMTGSTGVDEDEAGEKVPRQRPSSGGGQPFLGRRIPDATSFIYLICPKKSTFSQTFFGPACTLNASTSKMLPRHHPTCRLYFATISLAHFSSAGRPLRRGRKGCHPKNKYLLCMTL